MRAVRAIARTADTGGSGFLRVARAPALGVDRLAREQLARTITGRAAGVEVAVRAVLAGLVRRACLGVVFGVVQRLGGRIVERQMRQVFGLRDLRQGIGDDDGADRASGRGEKAPAAVVSCLVRGFVYFAHKYTPLSDGMQGG